MISLSLIDLLTILVIAKTHFRIEGKGSVCLPTSSTSAHGPFIWIQTRLYLRRKLAGVTPLGRML
jgi:hypothetical protein